jgi:hypothetical protein
VSTTPNPPFLAVTYCSPPGGRLRFDDDRIVENWGPGGEWQFAKVPRDRFPELQAILESEELQLAAKAFGERADQFSIHCFRGETIVIAFGDHRLAITDEQLASAPEPLIELLRFIDDFAGTVFDLPRILKGSSEARSLTHR